MREPLHEQALGPLGLVSLEGLGPRAFAMGLHEPYVAFWAQFYPPLRQKVEGKTLITCILLDLPSFIFPYVQMN